MKIAIQGHASRGPKIIQILESLGGKNTAELNGHAKSFYHIDKGEIRNDCYRPINCRTYTLEEFEEEFPFKIGDKIRDCSDNETGTILGFFDNDGELMYDVDFDNSGRACMLSNTLELYKEMKEKRNIVLTLEKAKEWYKKDGELKEVALQAYSEEELTKVELPKSWEEFCNKYSIKIGEAYVNSLSKINEYKYARKRELREDRNICPSQKSAKAHLAMIQLEQLRNCWWNGWEPIWDCSEKWCIGLWGNELSIGVVTNTSKFLTFPTEEMAEEFLKCFRDLIEKAKDLI